jgi:transcriptional regulator with GAF, ATPase, and Fis domain
MVGGTILSTALIQLIEAVATSESQAQASQTLLKSLLNIFQMDQASLFEKEKGELRCIMAIDASGKILQSSQEIYSSTTLLEKTLLAMEPLNLRLTTHDERTPASIKDDSLKQVVCLPLARAPGTAIFLGSRSINGRNFSTEEMGQFKTAARASWLAIRQFKTQESLDQTRSELKQIRKTQSNINCRSAVMETLLKEMERIAPFNISLLLNGESGVGKEEAARFIHQKSGRPGAFVAVNCANLSESLLESELFGYRKGAFTGAIQHRDGLFKAADGGTLFLDEVAEIPMNLQAKLLRAIQERRVRPVGGNEEIQVDVRIIAATHQDLERKIEAGGFRADLYYRIQEFVLRIPSLRERPEDIEILATVFINQAVMEMNLPPRQLGPEALQVMQAYPWNGNIRELKSICRTAVILASDKMIRPQDLRIQSKPVVKAEMTVPVQASASVREKSVSNLPNMPLSIPLSAGANLRDLSRNFERQIVRQLLDEGQSQVEIASRLGVSVRTVQRLMTDDDASDLQNIAADVEV